MKRQIFRILRIDDLIRLKTGLSVLARWTNVYTFVISLPPHFIRQEGSASELGFLEIKDFGYGT
jgi:hypothetical protein